MSHKKEKMEMGLSLFDFEVTQTELSEEELENLFNEMLMVCKMKGNPYVLYARNLSREIRNCLEEFESRNWIYDYDFRKFSISDELIMFHTVDELLNEYEEKMRNIVQSEGVCWYSDVLSLRNFFGPIRYQNKEDRSEFHREKRKITKKYALQLGLNHFYEVPSSRGMKMNSLGTSWEKQNVIPVIAENVLAISDIDEMEDFFDKYIFFCGRSDWGRYREQLAPRPEYKKICISDFELACLTQAKDVKTVSDILEYVGYASGRYYEENKNIIYPDGWSYQVYYESLTEEDHEKIRLDNERLKRLHGKDYID